MDVKIIKKENNDKYAVIIDGVFSFNIAEETYFRFNLHSKEIYSKEDIKSIRKTENLSKAKSDALKFLSFKLRTQFELEKKLLEKAYTSPVIEDIVKDLKDLGYINDKDYAFKYIKESRKLKPRSKSKLIFELKQKGIQINIIEEVFSEFTIDEYDDALKLVLKRYNLNDGKTSKSKVINFLKYRGYSSDTIIKILNDMSI